MRKGQVINILYHPHLYGVEDRRAALNAAKEILNIPTLQQEVECWFCHVKYKRGEECSSCGRILK